jgi:Uncharacterized conserved protein
MSSFNTLINNILQVHTNLQANAIRAINLNLTLRNWLIGFYIIEFEQNGKDRAKYGTQLLKNIAASNILSNIKSMDMAELSRFRQFYLTYPYFLGTVSQYLNDNSNLFPILGTLSQELETEVYSSPKLLTQVSFSHFVEFIKINDVQKRIFYETECAAATWSIRELRRQIDSLLFERCGMSINAKKLLAQTKNRAQIMTVDEVVKSSFVFEFLGLKKQESIHESDLEEALCNHLQEFLLELGDGFCFEARQKRILIDDEYFYADLVFYHRILKCHVLLELKTDRFKHEYLSQLNTYVSYYNDQIKRADDNPTIGILLCTSKGKKLVEYALAGMDEKLFVSKYLVELPSKEQFVDFVMKETQASYIIKSNKE